MAHTISKRRAIRILSDRGWQKKHTTKHEFWTNGKHKITLPISPNGDLYGFMARQIRRIEAGLPIAKEIQG